MLCRMPESHSHQNEFHLQPGTVSWPPARQRQSWATFVLEPFPASPEMDSTLLWHTRTLLPRCLSRPMARSFRILPRPEILTNEAHLTLNPRLRNGMDRPVR